MALPPALRSFGARRIATARRMIEAEKIALRTDISNDAKRMYVTGILLCDERGFVANDVVDAAMFDRTTQKAVAQLLYEASELGDFN